MCQRLLAWFLCRPGPLSRTPAFTVHPPLSRASDKSLAMRVLQFDVGDITPCLPHLWPRHTIVALLPMSRRGRVSAHLGWHVTVTVP